MDYEYSYEVNSGVFGAAMAVWIVVAIAIYVVTAVGLWKMFTKAGRPGWAAIIPFYNWWVWVEIIGRPRWWFWLYLAATLLSWIPILGWIMMIAAFVIYLLACLDMAKSFGKGSGFGIGLWLVPFVFAPILGFGDSQYIGPAAASAAGSYGAAPPPPPAGGYAAPTAPPAPPAAPVTPTTTAAPSAPVTPPETPPASPDAPPAPPADSPPPPPLS